MNKSKINNSRTRNLSRFSTILSVFLILVLIITSISGIASAKDANEHADSAFPTEKLSWNWLGLNNLNLTLDSSNYTYGHFDNVEIVYTSQDDIYDDVNLLSSGTGTQPQILKIPDRFDLRTEGRTPPLKDQGIFSTCWAFAYLGSIKSNLLTKDISRYTGVDLSEHHLAYFANYRKNIENIPELSGISNDTSYTKPQNKYMHNGGYFFSPMMTLMSWIGPVDANAALYPENDESLIYLNEKLAYYADEAHVQNVTLIHSQNMDGIKANVMKQGACVLAFNCNQSIDEETGESRYFKDLGDGTEFSYYYPYKGDADHEVIIIGWDDNFKIENFTEQPSHKGAWLVQNSWGENNPYIWISYDDPSISKANADATVEFYDADPVSKYDNNYQYDGAADLGYCCVMGENNVSTATIANAFTAAKPEYLKAVSFATLQPDVHYSIQVYHNLRNHPSDGDELLSTPVEGVAQYIGYHTIPLPEGLLLSENGGEDIFSVVINLTTYDDNELRVVCEMLTDHKNYYSEPYIEVGQSYLINPDNNKWMDFSDLTEEKGYGNIRIKAYTTNVDPKQSQKFAGGDGTLESPYEIETAEQLDFIRYGLGKHYKLIDDIDLLEYSEDEGWEPIGTEDLSQFYGSLDGEGHTISNLTINRPDDNEVGLFGRTHNAKIMNLKLENVNVIGNNSVGGLIGNNLASELGPKANGYTSEHGYSIIQSCQVSGTVAGHGSGVGGLVGVTEATGSRSVSLEKVVAAISESSYDGCVIGANNVGGLVGLHIAQITGPSIITNSYAKGNVQGKNVVGGLVGYHYSNVSQATIQNCYATVAVNGEDYVGGIVGSSEDTMKGQWVKEGVGAFVINCTALNPFVFGANTNVSRVIGDEDCGVSANNYALSSMICSNVIGEVATGAQDDTTSRSATIYGEDVTQENAGSEKFYSSTLGWNFKTTWKIDEKGNYPYPLLQSSKNVPTFETEITELPLPTTSGRYTLGADILMDSTWDVSNASIVLDLNGYNITLTNNEMSVISVTNNSVLFITDNSEYADGQITHSEIPAVGETDGQQSMGDEVFGGGVYIDNGLLIQAGGTIAKNSAKHGGGVCVGSGMFLLAGGAVTENVANELGGGVLVFGESLFTQIGGEVSSNIALTESGGGVAIAGGKFILCGGNITNNYAKATGGGVFVPTDKVSGDIMISGGGIARNFAGENKAYSNVYLSKNKVLRISERGLGNETVIGVSTEVEPTKDMSVAITSENDVDYSRYFFSDNSLHHIGVDENNVSYLVKTVPVAPALPIRDISFDLDGSVTIEVLGGATVDESGKYVKIEDTNSEVALILEFDTPQLESSTTFTGKVTQAVAEYPNSATVPNSTIERIVDVFYKMDLKLSNVTNFLPEIDVTINETVRELVESQADGLGVATMITAVGENVSRVNGNITENGVSIVFTVPASWYESMKGGVFMFHVKDGAFVDGTSPVEVVGVKNGDVYQIQVIGSTFSSYGIAGKAEADPEPEPTPTPTPTPSGGGGSSGSSTWATVTPTSTTALIEAPTATSTGEPTGEMDDDPTATSSTQTKTPVPVVGLVIGGVALVFVLRRK